MTPGLSTPVPSQAKPAALALDLRVLLFLDEDRAPER